VELSDFFEPGPEKAYEVFENCQFPWEPLHRLKAFVRKHLDQHGTRVPSDLPKDVIIQGEVYIEDGAIIESGTFIAGPTLIFKGAEVRFGAYIRGNVIVAEKAVVGHDTEVKHSILLPGSKAAHFAYVGDSILGRDVNLGAGTKCANLKVDMGKATVRVKLNDSVCDTGLRKIGAIFGDHSSVGCNTVTNPGTLIGKNTLAYAMSSLAGTYPSNSIIKLKQQTTVTPRRA
jgi:UDP-N-acetylglucosamine diphosphorylase / glucose-1-phosphate thymidylyltransferase / UDP-N-acetylgalactosamine diphosphorylase / glucosamine-1-phosphate N-acetyltransferase / galactosamine-1-phosphate N-acetyltransferase